MQNLLGILPKAQQASADGKAYRPPTVVLYRGTTHASCGGVAESAMGPFYCPADQKIYQRTADSKAAANHIQLQLQLEADCLAGIWGNRENEMLKSAGKPPFIQPGDVEAALRTAAAIGDDTLQGRGRDYAVPDPIIHASAEQRQRWFNTGFRSGSVASCNTFAAAQL